MRLAQVFSNSLNNAAKCSGPGGMIVVRARHDQVDAVISVCDRGHGIETDLLPCAFELFL